MLNMIHSEPLCLINKIPLDKPIKLDVMLVSSLHLSVHVQVKIVTCSLESSLSFVGAGAQLTWRFTREVENMVEVTLN